MAATATLKATVKALGERVRALASSELSPLEKLRRDPLLLMTAAGMTPDEWQSRLLLSPAERTLLLCSRQAGKSQVAAAIALKTALLEPRSLVLILSPSERQSGEIFKDKLLPLYNALGRPVPSTAESALQLSLTNGSRIIALPGQEGTIRCYSGVKLLLIDEASRVPDSLYRAVRPMLAVSRGRLLCLSTPFGRRGFFYEAWEGDQAKKDRWRRVRVTADQVPRITAEFLAEERRELGERWFQQEYFCEFLSSIGAVFSGDDIDAAFAPSVQTLEIAL